MSLPRPIVPGTTYLITRRCSQRQLLLRTSACVNQILLYCLAEAASRYHVRLHAYCFLSNHYHLVVTDLDGQLPEFCRWLAEFVAKCINASLGRWECVFAPGTYNAVRLEDPEAVLDKMVYVLANPVSAGLVRDGRQWPGVRSRPEDVGRTVVARRPEVFFRSDGDMPQTSSLDPTLTHHADKRPLRARISAGLTLLGAPHAYIHGVTLHG
jgi:REP element-mobilizing transposase RayT